MVIDLSINDIVKQLPSDMPLDQALAIGMDYLLPWKPKITSWIEILLPPSPPAFVHRYFIESSGPNAYIGFMVNGDVSFLPDIISKILQRYGGFNITKDIMPLVAIKIGLTQFIDLFLKACNLRLALQWFLNINPYRFPISILVEMTDWFLESGSTTLPIIFGIDIGTLLLLRAGEAVHTIIEDLAFTMPYLPSEGVRQTVGKFEVVRFSGIPKLWLEQGIPNEVREYWFKEDNLKIIDHLMKNYSDLKLNFVPDRILEKYVDLHSAISNISDNFELLSLNSSNVFHFGHNIENFI